MCRIGVLYSGISFQHETMNRPGLRGRFIPIPIYELPTLDLRRFDALIVPRSIDQVALNDYRRVIREFLDLPGIVVALGDYRGKWLPGCRAGGFTPEDDQPLIKVRDHALLEGIDSRDLHWHKGINGLCSHGHLTVPPDATILITNSRGDVILYEDRLSTPGIIVAGSQFDIFCHCFSNDEGALRAMTNLLAWIGDQAPSIRERRSRKKIGVVYSGLHFHRDLFTRPEYDDTELVYIRYLHDVDLRRYHVLIVPRESNQELLLQVSGRLTDFLNHGRTLVSFGEVVRPWLPNLVWENRRPMVCPSPTTVVGTYDKGEVITENLRIETSDHALFEGITLDDLRWHYHGIFHPQPGQTVLLSDGRGGAVILLDEWAHGGKVLATTLDPEEHAGFGAVTITEKFMARCMAWIRSEAGRLSKL
jgi:hypothetical protein